MPDRMFRHGLIDSETIASLHDKTYRLYTFLLLAQDDWGLVPISFGAVKAASPLQDWNRETIAKMLGELIDAGLLLPYEIDGKQFAALARTQNYVNTVKPKYPFPPFGMQHFMKPRGYKNEAVRLAVYKICKHINEDTSDGVPPVPHHDPTIGARVRVGVMGKGVMGKGVMGEPRIESEKGIPAENPEFLIRRKAGSSPPSHGYRLPPDWSLPLEWGTWAMKEHNLSKAQVQRISLIFKDFWIAKAGKDARKLDWAATWRNWVRKDAVGNGAPPVRADHYAEQARVAIKETQDKIHALHGTKSSP